jgi:hypothetical protein
MMSGRLPSLPKNCQKEQQKKRQGRGRPNQRKFKCPKDEEWAREKQHRQMKGNEDRDPEWKEG